MGTPPGRLPSDGVLPALLGQLSQQLQLSEEELDKTRKYLDSRRCTTLASLAAMDTLQWAKAQRSAGMRPQLLASLVAEVEKQHPGQPGGAPSDFSSLLRCCWSPHCQILAVGSWSLLCVLDLADVWRGDAAQDGEKSSKAIGLIVLGVAISALVFALAQQSSHWKASPAGKAADPPEAVGLVDGSGDERRTAWSRWVFAIHAVLIGGSIVWLLFHAFGQRGQQVWIGLATLYSVSSLAAVQSFASCWRRRDGGLAEPVDIDSSSKQDAGGTRPALTLAPIDTPNVASHPVVVQKPTLASITFLDLDKHRKCIDARWTPIFADPTFGGETKRRLSTASKTSLATARAPNEMFSDPWQIKASPPTSKAESDNDKDQCRLQTHVLGSLQSSSSLPKQDSAGQVQRIPSKASMGTPQGSGGSAMSDVSDTFDRSPAGAKEDETNALSDVSLKVAEVRPAKERDNHACACSEDGSAFSDVSGDQLDANDNLELVSDV